MLTIYKFNLDCGRMGSLRSAFIADSAVVAKAYGREAYFGEVLGKHSEVYCDLDASHLTAISTDPAAIEIVAKLGLDLGLNPLAHLRCLKCRENESDPDDLSCGYCRAEAAP